MGILDPEMLPMSSEERLGFVTGMKAGTSANRLDVCPDGSERTVTPAQQVEVTRGAVGLIRPEAQQHRALEYEAFPGFRLPEAIEETLEAEARQQCLVNIAHLHRPVEQPRGDGSGQVALAGGHAVASR